MEKYTIGLDYGTLSLRGIIVSVVDGRQIASAQFAYPHGVMDTSLPGGIPLPPGWALQHPQDYLDALDAVVPALMRESGLPPESIAGIGVDFTACTMLPVTAEGMPLCFLPAYEKEPHAYVKLWKHQTAQPQADRITALAAERDEPFLKRCGGKAYAQNAFPKLLQLLEEAPQVYNAMDLYVEAADWVVWRLTGRFFRSANCLGFKAFYDLKAGFPDRSFFAALAPGFGDVLETKMAGPVSPVGAKAGAVAPGMARRLGVAPGTAVATPMVDGHVCFPASGIDGPGKLLGIMGTSAPYFLLSPYCRPIPSLCGVVDDGLIPGFTALEAGLNCVGDQFAWAAETCSPSAYRQEASEKGISLQTLLTEKAAKLRPGESGLIALDWWNGSRSLLMDPDVSGLIAGMTLATRPEEIYRALLEAIAFATRVIVEHFNAYGVPVSELRLTGGVSHKNPFLMQVLADVLRLPVAVLATDQGSALGSAIYGAVASGACPSLTEAIRRMASPIQQEYRPRPENFSAYDRLYGEYRLLYDRFGLQDGMMKRLGRIRREAADAAKNEKHHKGGSL